MVLGALSIELVHLVLQLAVLAALLTRDGVVVNDEGLAIGVLSDFLDILPREQQRPRGRGVILVGFDDHFEHGLVTIGQVRCSSYYSIDRH